MENIVQFLKSKQQSYHVIGKPLFHGGESFRQRKRQKFWRWMVVMMAQHWHV